MDHQNQYKFTEGENHSFKIIGFKEIPETEESFFILENFFGGKHLLKANPFKHYHLEINQQINCRIDKINCSGKIYLEPENPIYKVGEIYDFELIRIIDHINSIGEKEKAAIVKDHFGSKTTCSLPKKFPPQKTKWIKCKVLRIKKGELFLSIPELVENKLEIGKIYSFKLFEIKKLEDEFDYYILKDDYENLYPLKKEMYEQYGFIINQLIKCYVTKYNADGHLKIEPVHPYYKIGKTYRFKFLYKTEEYDLLGNKEIVIVVEDVYGLETNVRTSKILSDKSFSDFITCKVEGIRKGKAILSIE